MFLYLALQFCILIIAITFHEFCHGWIAYKLGDPTAKYAGRLTLNPLAHIDPFGTIIFPLLLTVLRAPFVIGWARPVPVNFLSLKNPKRDMFWVGLAGPASNLLMASLFLIALRIFPSISPTLLGELCVYGVIINAILAVFNIIPIPPLDGSRILTALLPYKYAYMYNQLEPYGFVIILILLASGILQNIINTVVPFVIKYLGLSISIF